MRHQPIEDMQLDAERGEFWGNFLWHGSWEAQAHLAHCGVSGTPACWTMVGYADGYSTRVTGVPIHWREVECVAMGHACCRVIGRPLAAWEADASGDAAESGADDHGSYLHIASFVDSPGRAANLDLREEVDAGRFRRDLFYRLNVFPIHIPPLRERLEDIPLLVALFLERARKRLYPEKFEAASAQAGWTWLGLCPHMSYGCVGIPTM